MDSYLVRRCLRIGGRQFNFSIEAHFWICFEDIARAQATTTERLAQSIVAAQANDHLSSAIRTYVIEYFRDQSQTLENIEPVPSAAMATDTANTWVDGSLPRWPN